MAEEIRGYLAQEIITLLHLDLITIQITHLDLIIILLRDQTTALQEQIMKIIFHRDQIITKIILLEITLRVIQTVTLGPIHLNQQIQVRDLILLLLPTLLLALLVAVDLEVEVQAAAEEDNFDLIKYNYK